MAPHVRPDAEAPAGVAPPLPPDEVVGRVGQTMAWLGGLAAGASNADDATRIDRIAALEQLKATVAAAQAAEMVAFGKSQVAQQQHLLVNPRKLGRGIGDQIALACKISPAAGSRRLELARAWLSDLPSTFDALRSGQVSEWVATLVARETSHLDVGTRRSVDAQLAAENLPSLSPRRAAACARALAYRADPLGAVQRAKTEEKERRVSLRPMPDCMTIFTAYLSAAQGVAAYAALRKAADAAMAAGDDRTRNQVMADTLVERVTGQATAQDLNIEVSLLMGLDTLTDSTSPRPAHLSGYGPLPAPLARDLFATTKGRRWWRRLFTGPRGHIVGGDWRRRRFTGLVAHLIGARDQTCRDPYCDAPIRHLDHIQRYADGGETTLANGRGVCERGNHVREMPGWKVERTASGLDGAPHSTITTTPTGHTYRSEAGRPP